MRRITLKNRRFDRNTRRELWGIRAYYHGTDMLPVQWHLDALGNRRLLTDQQADLLMDAGRQISADIQVDLDDPYDPFLRDMATCWHWSLERMEQMHKAGYFGPDADEYLDKYLALWNATPGRFTVAEWRDGAIRQRERTDA